MARRDKNGMHGHTGAKNGQSRHTGAKNGLHGHTGARMACMAPRARDQWTKAQGPGPLDQACADGQVAVREQLQPLS